MKYEQKSADFLGWVFTIAMVIVFFLLVQDCQIIQNLFSFLK